MSWRLDYMRLIGQLKKGRTAAGLTQADVAARLGVSHRMFQRYEGCEVSPSGAVYEPPLMLVFQWASAVGVKITSDMTHFSAAPGGADGAPRRG